MVDILANDADEEDELVVTADVAEEKRAEGVTPRNRVELSALGDPNSRVV